MSDDGGPTGKAPRKGLTYRDSGVDVDEESRSVQALVGALGSVRAGRPGEPIPLPGGFAGLVRLGDQALALCTDGVGSKLEIARAMGRFDTVGVDCMAMNVNDAVCVGAEPIAFVDYLAVEEHEEGFMRQVGEGLARAARLADVSVVGGETATLPGIVRGFDLAGTCLGVVPRDRVVTGEKVAPGDAIVAVSSFGVHSNGFSLVRRLLEQESLSLDEAFPGHGLQDHPVGEVLLEPTRIYVRAALALLRSGVPVHGMAHVTGGGLGNLPRMNRDVAYRLEAPLRPQGVFDWIAQAGDVERKEMYRTFNMGMGFAVVVPEDRVREAVRVLQAATRDDAPFLVPGNVGEAPREVGHVDRGGGVLLEPDGLHFEV